MGSDPTGAARRARRGAGQPSAMRIERVIVQNMRALARRDDAYVGPAGAWTSACLRGLNGSGKTT